jgi:hypothetical protein
MFSVSMFTGIVERESRVVYSRQVLSGSGVVT